MELAAPSPQHMLAPMRRRWPILAVVSAAALAALAALTLPAAEDRLLYNHTPSVPVGFYIRTDEPLERGSFVTVRAIDVAPAAAAARGFNGPRDRFIKRVAALAGDHVCARADVVTLNGGPRYARRAYDSTGAALPAWEACRVLGPDEILILGDTADSFDGRYWGPINVQTIEGVWRRL